MRIYLKFTSSHRDFVEAGIIDNIIKLLEKHLQPTLNIMLKRQPQFPLSPSFSKCLQQIIQNKTLLAKTFNYLTDILNNPDQGSIVEIFEPLIPLSFYI